MRDWLVGCLLLLGLAAGSRSAVAQDTAQAPAKKPLNVLLIVSDDLNNSLGCYGHSFVKTPNLDRLASQGVRFDRAYCQFPLCNPSRASFMSGRRPDMTTVYDNGRHFRTALPDAVTMPQLFQQAGYTVVRVGKIYHYSVPAGIGTEGFDDPPSWQRTINPKGRDKTDEDQILQYTGKKGSLGAAISFLAAEGTSAEQTDGMIATETIKLLEANRERPFFLACGFFRPHVPCVAPKSFFSLYPTANLKLPVDPKEHFQDIPKAALQIQPLNYGLEDAQLTEFLQGYYASVTFMDEQVGRVLEALQRLGLAESTIVVFISDHGYLLGEHGQWMKQSLYEPSARVPMLIRAPGMPGNGKSSTRTVELVDLYPTIAELAGLTAPAGLDGESLVPLLNDPARDWDHPAFTQVFRLGKQNGFHGRSVRTERYRYIEFDNGARGMQLFDEVADPQEYRNLASDPQHAQTVRELQALLRPKAAETK